MMAGMLFARAGLRATVLEKHGDFLRDFRGDTVHPSTLRLLSELGMLERFELRPHNKVPAIRAWVGDRRYKVADFSGFDRRWAHIAIMPQWEFLDFLADEAGAWAGFDLRMETEAHALVERDGRVEGLRIRTRGQEMEISARLVVAADGRDSRLRAAAGLPVVDLGAPIDVFWFRIPKSRGETNETTGLFRPGRLIALIDRGDYWQCAFVFSKGQSGALRERGLDAFRRDVVRAAPMVADAVDAIASWDEVKLLTVKLDRLETWSKPGLLVIGDAAHAMSPIGGVGINLAIQDAVAAANVLAAPLREGRDVDDLLDAVRRRRMPAIRIVQGFQKLVQQRVIGPLLDLGEQPIRAPLPVRLLDRFTWLRRLPAAFIGFGPRSEHIRSPQA
jgi:2-polyprenyl-6-methoxyphenol hydroxylase-like FAD-dependent oxidoreductase